MKIVSDRLEALQKEPLVGWSVVATSEERDAVENLIIMRTHSKGSAEVPGHRRSGYQRTGKGGQRHSVRDYSVGPYMAKYKKVPRVDSTSAAAMRRFHAVTQAQREAWLRSGSRNDLVRYLRAYGAAWEAYTKKRAEQIGAASGQLQRSIKFWSKVP